MISQQSITFKNVFKDNQLQKDAVSFWNQVVPNAKFDRQERSKHVVFMAYFNQQPIAVTTAQPKLITKLNNNYFYNFRILIHPEYRIPGLLDKLSQSTIKYLEDLYLENQTECIGLITLIENTQLNEKRREPIYPTTGFVFIGFSKKGFQVRVRYFKGAKI